MARPYVTGPALIYVGFPVQFNSILAQSVPQLTGTSPFLGFTPTLAGGGVTSSGPQVPGALARGGRPVFGVSGASSFLSSTNIQPGEFRAAINEDLIPGNFQSVISGLGAGQVETTIVNVPQIGLVRQFIGQVTRTFIPVFLGTAEVSPEIEILPNWIPLFRTISGNKTPFDQMYDGEQAVVVADINRYNETVYALMAARSAPPGRQIPGVNLPGEIGTLMAKEQVAPPLWIVFPYRAKRTAGDMIPGYRFFSANLIGPDKLSNLGTKPKKIRLIWNGLRLYDKASGIHFLYDHNMSGLTPPN